MGETGSPLAPVYLGPIFLVPGGGSVYPHVEPPVPLASIHLETRHKADRIIALVQGAFDRLMDGMPQGERAMITAALAHVALERNSALNSPRARDVSEHQIDIIYDRIVDDKQSGKH